MDRSVRTAKFLLMSAIFSLLANTSFGASEFESLTSMYGSGDRLKDPVEAEYLANRCASVNGVMFTVYDREADMLEAERDARHRDVRKSARNFEQAALFFAEISMRYASGRGHAIDSLEKRLQILGTNYAEMYAKNKSLHNVGARGVFREDMLFCKAVVEAQFFQRLPR